ncbi:hypothetical protein ACBJ59_12535 [Nonomuraea sp. MTCD27]|uniref:hypothetical protein n=1 Tax=Nonomuraea sp. MTCD27 TaxID=1676747 RepID=UPI0035BFC46C
MTVAGVLVLLVNDHLLKQAWPGFVTGKLSDVAGLLVAPALVALVFWRRADLAATVLTGALFAVVKCTETGAEVATQAWTLVAGPSRVLADPTDLLALPALALAWWVRRRTPDRPRVLRSRLARLRIIVTMPLAVLAVTATAAAAPPASAEAVEVDRGGRIVVHTNTTTSWVSHDGGRTWDETTADRTGPGQSAQCTPGQATRCYRVAQDRMAVEQSDDGGSTWQPSWALSGDDLKRLTRQHEQPGDLRAMALGVQARPGGHVVVVANGVDGIVVRDPSGTWRRVGWPGAEATAVDLDPEWSVALFLAACMLFGGAGAGLRQFTGVYTGFATAACLGLLALVGTDTDFPYVDTGAFPLPLVGLTALLIGTVVCFVLAIAGRARPVPAAVGLLGAPLVYASVYLPFSGWAQGTPESYFVAAALAMLLTALVVVAGAVLIRNDARRANAYFFDGTSTSSPT